MSESVHEIHITPKGSNLNILQELNHYRRLVYFFTWREYKVRYKQTALGILWVALQPLVFMGIVQLILLRRGENDFGVEGVPAWILVFLGFVMWQYFEGSFSGSLQSFVSNQGLFKKIYFPKIVPAVAFVISRLIDLGIGMLLLVFLSLIFGFQLHLIGFYLFIPITIVMGTAALGAGLFFGTLNVQFRDVKQILPFVTRIAFLSTPIFWPLSFMPENIQKLLYINPAAAGIQTMREALYDPEKIRWSWLWIPLVSTTIMIIFGIWFFKKRERTMVDIV